MNLIEIERALRELRLSGIAATLNTRVMQAQSSQEPYLDTFASMLQDELDRRRSRLTERRFKQSGLDERLSLADIDWRFTRMRAWVIANGLTLHPDKTHLGDCREDGQGFEFLGYRFEAGKRWVRTVSYTHLTLPTNREV